MLNINTRQALLHLQAQINRHLKLDSYEKQLLLEALEHVEFSCIEFGSQAEEKGFDCFLNGKAFSSNPYQLGTRAAKQWEDGWYSPLRFRYVRKNIEKYRYS